MTRRLVTFIAGEYSVKRSHEQVARAAAALGMSSLISGKFRTSLLKSENPCAKYDARHIVRERYHGIMPIVLFAR